MADTFVPGNFVFDKVSGRAAFVVSPPPGVLTIAPEVAITFAGTKQTVVRLPWELRKAEISFEVV